MLWAPAGQLSVSRHEHLEPVFTTVRFPVQRAGDSCPCAGAPQGQVLWPGR